MVAAGLGTIIVSIIFKKRFLLGIFIKINIFLLLFVKIYFVPMDGESIK